MELNERGYMLVSYCEKVMDKHTQDYGGPDGFTSSDTMGDR